MKREIGVGREEGKSRRKIEGRGEIIGWDRWEATSLAETDERGDIIGWDGWERRYHWLRRVVDEPWWRFWREASLHTVSWSERRFAAVSEAAAPAGQRYWKQAAGGCQWINTDTGRYCRSEITYAVEGLLAARIRSRVMLSIHGRKNLHLRIWALKMRTVEPDLIATKNYCYRWNSL